MKRQRSNYAYNEVAPFKDFKDVLEQATAQDGDRTAFKYKVEGKVIEVTYREFEQSIKELGSALTSLGVIDGHIAIVSSNRYEYVQTYFALCNAEKAVAVPVDKELPFEEIANIINHSDAQTVFFSMAYENNLREKRDLFPNVKYFIGYDLQESDGEFISYKSLMEKGKELMSEGYTDYTSQTPVPENLKFIVYTSGTTGVSKGVMLSLNNLISCVYYGLHIAFVEGTCISALPYHHTYEAVCDLLVSVHKHNTICINESLRTVAENMKLYKPDYMMLVPLFVESFYKKIWAGIEDKGLDGTIKKLIKVSNALLKVGIDLRKVFFKSIHEIFGGNLQKIVCGGAPMRAELGDFFEAIGITVLNGYGITECSPLVAVNRDYFYDWESAGVALPCLEVTIDNPNEDKEGEICVKGPTVMMGYYKREDITKEVLEEDGRFHTGDYGKIDEQGRIYITGRKKNLIVLKNGKNIYPEEIEDYIMGIDLVKEVVVTALRNENNEEIGLNAEIYPNSDKFKDVESEEVYRQIKDAVNELNAKLPKYKRIVKVELRDEPFTKTTTGKIKRNYNK